MKQQSSMILRIFSMLTVMVVIAMLTMLGAPMPQTSYAQPVDPWLEIEEAAPLTPGNPMEATAPAAEVQGHLGYDKATGQYLSDPTIILNPATSSVDLALLEQQRQEKLAAVDSTQIRFRSGYTIHPQPGIAPEVLDRLGQSTEAASADSYYVVQFSYPFPTQARLDLEAAGVTFYDDLDVAAGLARIPPEALDDLQAQTQDGLVKYVGAIPQQARLSPELADLAAKEPEGSSDIVLLTFEQPTQAQLDQLSAWFTVGQRSDGPIHILEGKAQHNGLDNLASLEYVRWIEPQVESEPGNLEGGMAMGADIVRGAGFNGTGINVSVVDTGIARSGATYHPDLLAGRVLDQWDYQNNDSNAADDNSHGTHVAGTIGGLYNAGSFDSIQAFQGVAPGSNFYIYKLCCDAGGTGFSSTWFQNAMTRGNDGARRAHVSNHSWGGGNGVYNTASEIADRAVRGEYGSDPVNMVIISHNDNALSRAPGTAKNAITVGAVKDGNYPDVTFATCGAFNDVNWPPGERACYSNFGPLDTDGNGSTRVKPDIMATGAMIYSPIPWYFGSGSYYGYKSGTSMAAPHVTGAVAQFLDHFPSLIDWPAIVKAFFLATAININAPADLNLYGRGMLNAYHANWYQPGIQDQSHWWGNSIGSTGQSIDFTFDVSAGYDEVIVVLTWADPAGATEAINDLDISYVKDASGVTRGSSSHIDDNVEYLRIPAGYTPGTWTIRVYGWSISSAQSFGLAANPILTPADLSISSLVEYIGEPTFAVDRGDFVYYHQYVSNSGYAAGGTYARLLVPDGFTVDGARVYTDDGASHYYLASELYHIAGSNYWRVALGATIAGSTRHVRWFLRANTNAACGSHDFQNQAYFSDAGFNTGSPGHWRTVAVTCYSYLPVAKR